MAIFTTILGVWTTIFIVFFIVVMLKLKRMKKDGSYTDYKLKRLADGLAAISWPLLFLWPIDAVLWLFSLFLW